MSKWFRVYGFADVHDRLLIGAYPLDREDVSMLEWMKIERILNLVEDQEYEKGEREKVRNAIYAAGIEEHRISLTDYGRLPAPQLEQAVGEVNQWLDQGHRVYVHCRAGWQRSAAVAAGVVALREGVGIEDALARVHRRKPSADPLPEQREDLLRWWAERDHGPEGDEASGDGSPEAGGETDGGAVRPSDESGETDGSAVSGETDDSDASPSGETEELLEWLDEHDPARQPKPKPKPKRGDGGGRGGAEPAKAGQPARPATAGQPAPAKAGQPARPGKSGKSAERAKPSNPARPARPSRRDEEA